MSARACLGILGGLGPLAGAHFYRRIIELTDATCDVEHIDVLLDGHCATPDRSAYLTGESDRSPLPDLLARSKRLCAQGVSCLAMPCNTAHAFYCELCRALPIPFLHIAVEATDALCRVGACSVGILCTRGTRESGLYDSLCGGLGIGCIYPDEAEQTALDALIFWHLKAGQAPSPDLLLPFFPALRARGAQKILLACTELSLCYREEAAPPDCVDALTVLARRCVLACGGRLFSKKEVSL